jgi:hypothetical protein
MMKYLEQGNLQLIRDTVLIPADTLKYDRKTLLNAERTSSILNF